MHRHLLLYVLVHHADLALEFVDPTDVTVKELGVVVGHGQVILLVCMSKQRLRQGKLRNLNFLIDEYEHIPQTANANEDYFVREKLRKHSSLRLFQLTRFRPNKWVEPKPPAKPVQYEQELRKDDISVQLRRKSYSSRPGYQLALSERQQKLQEEVKKLSSLKVFD